VEKTDMIKTIEDLKIEYKEYSDINGKIRRDIHYGKYIPVIRGIYETNENTPGYFLSSYIYGPSYLSFEYALSFYGIIPERVNNYTMATFNKRKKKTYVTSFGTFIYRDVPKAAYPFEIRAIEENSYVYFLASKEKAICDTLYSSKPIYSIKQLKELMFEDFRIDVDEFSKLDMDKICLLIPKYQSQNLGYLKKMIKGVSHANTQSNVREI